MTALSSGDFGPGRFAQQGDYSGKTRDQIFQLKINDKKRNTFIIGTTEGGIKVIGVKYEIDKKGKRWFTYVLPQWKNSKKEIQKEKQITVFYNKVFKSPDFGGGARGSGGGTAETKITESLQCYYNSYIYNTGSGVRRNGELLKKPPTEKELEATAHHCRTTHTLKYCRDNVPDSWINPIQVFCITANGLWNSELGKNFKSRPVRFHRAGPGTGTGSTFMDKIYKAKTNCLKRDKESGKIQQAPGTFSHDKWNPGDIWMTTLGFQDKPLLEKKGKDEKFTVDWSTLNTEVERLANAGTVLGVSLKKLKTANVKEFNRSKVAKNTYSFTSYSFGQLGDFFNSKDVYLAASSGEMQLRTFGEPWQGQIKGLMAGGGKIGGGNIDYYLKEIYKQNIYGTGGEKGMKSVVQNYTEDLKSDFWKLYHLCVIGGTPEGVSPIITESQWEKQSKTATNNPKKEKEFYKLLDAKDSNWRYSKYMCLKTLEILLSGSVEERNDFITQIWLYAASDTIQSSFFIKIAD